MKLEVGQFVRFKDKRGNEYIRKIVEIPEDNRYASLYLDKDANYSKGLSIKNVIKASYNIIDILEVGDYVNGERIINIIPIDICGNEILDNQHIFTKDGEIFENEIKSIITKEQFEQMSYEIVEKNKII